MNNKIIIDGIKFVKNSSKLGFDSYWATDLVISKIKLKDSKQEMCDRIIKILIIMPYLRLDKLCNFLLPFQKQDITNDLVYSMLDKGILYFDKNMWIQVNEDIIKKTKLTL